MKLARQNSKAQKDIQNKVSKIVKRTLLSLSMTPILLLPLASQAITITNKSPFYFYPNTSNGSTCPAVDDPTGKAPGGFAPGEVMGDVSGYCGYIACAVKQTNFNYDNGCQEVTNGNTADTSPTPGGYATYFGINLTSTTPCRVSYFVPYTYQIDNAGNLSLQYASVTQPYNNNTPVKISSVTRYNTGLLFRGINMSGLEYDGSFLDALSQHPDIPDALYFANQGMNTIRLPIRAEYLIVHAGDPTSSSIADLSASPLTINTNYLNGIYDTVQKYLNAGISVDLDLHNYMRFCPTGSYNNTPIGQGNEATDPVNNRCTLMTPSQLALIWTTLLSTPVNIPVLSAPAGSDPTYPGSISDHITGTLASLAQQFSPKPNDFAYQQNTQLILGIMNEPFSQQDPRHIDQDPSVQTIFDTEMAAVIAIRKLVPNNLILMSGNGWDPLHAWTTSYPNMDGKNTDPSNANIFTQANIVADLSQADLSTDTSNIAVEVHQYFDSNYSGTQQVCTHYNSQDDFNNTMNLTPFVQWMTAEHMKVFLSEFGGSDDSASGPFSGPGDCVQDMNWILDDLTKNAYSAANPRNGGFVGWMAWRTNRHGAPGAGFAPFNYLQQANYNVYFGSPGNPSANPPTPRLAGILQGQGNGLMTNTFAHYLGMPYTLSNFTASISPSSPTPNTVSTQFTITCNPASSNTIPSSIKVILGVGQYGYTSKTQGSLTCNATNSISYALKSPVISAGQNVSVLMQDMTGPDYPLDSNNAFTNVSVINGLKTTPQKK